MTTANTILGLMLQQATLNGTDYISNMTNWMSALSDYISTCTLNGLFTGALIAMPFTPITEVPSTGDLINASELKGCIAFCQDPQGGDGQAEWENWIDSIYNFIKTTVFITGTMSIPTGPINAFSNLQRSWDRSDLLSAFNSNPNDSSGLICDTLATKIITDLQIGFTPTFPCIWCTSYTGVTTVTSVLCP